jgi:transcriptional regulator with XRE-family HTH domain
MITNERQYKITRSEADRFRKAIGELVRGPAREDVHPRLLQAEREAMQSQLDDLQAELLEYDRLKSADLSVISVNSFEGLADGLIKARIASGLSQKALAERLGLKEQQIQRYEAERYGSASYQRLREIADALGVRITNDILLPVAPHSFGGLVSKLRQVGLDRDFLLSRLLPSADAARASGEVAGEDYDAALSAKTGAILQNACQSRSAGNQPLCGLRELSGRCRAERCPLATDRHDPGRSGRDAPPHSGSVSKGGPEKRSAYCLGSRRRCFALAGSRHFPWRLLALRGPQRGGVEAELEARSAVAV